MSIYIALDIGGTQIRAACYLPDQLKPVRLERISTQDTGKDGLGSSPLERLKSLIASIWPEGETVAAISVAAPGAVNPYTGVMYEAPNIPGWDNLPLRQELQDRFSAPVLVGNDANLAAVGEWKFGAARGHHHVVYMTISTGIGGGVIMDDRLLLGKNGLAGEIGHMPIMPDGPLCGCGCYGHLEAVASGTGIAHWVEEQLAQGVASVLPAGQPVTAKKVAQAAQKGDALSQEAVARAGSILGRALAGYLHIFNPSIVVLGGGVSRSGPLWFEPMQKALREHVFTPQYLDDLIIAPAALGDEAGLVGAFALARMQYP